MDADVAIWAEPGHRHRIAHAEIPLAAEPMEGPLVVEAVELPPRLGSRLRLRGVEDPPPARLTWGCDGDGGLDLDDLVIPADVALVADGTIDGPLPLALRFDAGAGRFAAEFAGGPSEAELTALPATMAPIPLPDPSGTVELAEHRLAVERLALEMRVEGTLELVGQSRPPDLALALDLALDVERGRIAGGSLGLVGPLGAPAPIGIGPFETSIDEFRLAWDRDGVSEAAAVFDLTIHDVAFADVGIVADPVLRGVDGAIHYDVRTGTWDATGLSASGSAHIHDAVDLELELRDGVVRLRAATGKLAYQPPALIEKIEVSNIVAGGAFDLGATTDPEAIAIRDFALKMDWAMSASWQGRKVIDGSGAFATDDVDGAEMTFALGMVGQPTYSRGLVEGELGRLAVEFDWDWTARGEGAFDFRRAAAEIPGATSSWTVRSRSARGFPSARPGCR